MKTLLIGGLLLTSLSGFATEPNDTKSAFANSVDYKTVDENSCFNSYREQAKKDLQTVADDSDIASYEGSTVTHTWTSAGGYSRSATDYFSINRGQVGAGVGFVTLLGIGLAGAPIPIFLPFTLGIFGGAAAQVAIETGMAARRLKSYAIISQARACSEQQVCNFEKETEMQKLFARAENKGFEGDIIEFTKKINDGLSGFCHEKLKVKKNGEKKSKVIRTYGLNKILKESGVI